MYILHSLHSGIAKLQISANRKKEPSPKSYDEKKITPIFRKHKFNTLNVFRQLLEFIITLCLHYRLLCDEFVALANVVRKL